MKQITFNVDLKSKDLYAFTMRHTYRSISGVFGLFISLASLIVCGVMFFELSNSTRLALLFVGLLFTAIQPAMLYLKCRKQIKLSKSINAPLSYTLSEKGIRISQKEESAEVKWYEVRKAVFAKKGIYVYMSPIRAFIFPSDQCNGNYETIRCLIVEMLEEYKDYVPEKNEEDADEDADVDTVDDFEGIKDADLESDFEKDGEQASEEVGEDEDKEVDEDED